MRIALSCILASMAVAPVAIPHVNTGKIEAEEIVLKSPNGNRVITISATDDYAGIMIKDVKEKRCVNLYNVDGQTAVGVQYLEGNHTMTAALGTTKKGEGFLQLSDGDDKVEFVTLGK